MNVGDQSSGRPGVLPWATAREWERYWPGGCERMRLKARLNA
jgi:hypothetical protein